MSARSRRLGRSRPAAGAVAVWLIALLVALVATVQIRSQAEVVRSLQGADPAALAFPPDLFVACPLRANRHAPSAFRGQPN